MQAKRTPRQPAVTYDWGDSSHAEILDNNANVRHSAPPPSAPTVSGHTRLGPLPVSSMPGPLVAPKPAQTAEPCPYTVEEPDDSPICVSEVSHKAAAAATDAMFHAAAGCAATGMGGAQQMQRSTAGPGSTHVFVRTVERQRSKNHLRVRELSHTVDASGAAHLSGVCRVLERPRQPRTRNGTATCQRDRESQVQHPDGAPIRSAYQNSGIQQQASAPRMHQSPERATIAHSAFATSKAADGIAQPVPVPALMHPPFPVAQRTSAPPHPCASLPSPMSVKSKG
jgi:hypothetical protein